MLVVFPIAQSDEQYINNFCKIVNQFGPYTNHEMLVVCRSSALKQGEKLYSNLKTSFKQHSFYELPNEGPHGHPLGPNFYWKSTISYLKETKNNKPWLWMETDMIPIKERWLDLLEYDYIKQGKPFFGCVEDTTTLTFDGHVVPFAKHLVGGGIYPPDVETYCTVWNHVDKIPVAFDVLCQAEIIPHTYGSKAFVNAYHTINYIQNENNEIVGEDSPKFKKYNMSYLRPITSETLIHHGCKDDSLVNLFLKK